MSAAVWKIGQPISVRQAEASRVSPGPVDLADRAGDLEGLLANVGGKRCVRDVDVVVRAEVDRGRGHDSRRSHSVALDGAKLGVPGVANSYHT
jgi:hypothetical protein